MLPKKSATSAVSSDPSISAVVKCVNLVIQHNSFYNIIDHLASVIRQKFSESKSAGKFTCGKTTTVAFANFIGDYFVEELKQGMQENPSRIMLDGNNETGLQKMYPITVRIYEVRFNQIMTRFFDMGLLEGSTASTAESMLASVAEQFNDHNFSWDYCVAIGLDNTNANIGE